MSSTWEGSGFDLCLQRDVLVSQTRLIFIGWHADAVSLPLGDAIFAQQFIPQNDVNFVYNQE